MSLSPLSAPAVLEAPPPSVSAEAREEPTEEGEGGRKEKLEEGGEDRKHEGEGSVQEKEEKGEETQEGLQEGVEKQAESEELDHPYDMLTRVQIDFEPYVLLLQVTQLSIPLAPAPGSFLPWSSANQTLIY